MLRYTLCCVILLVPASAIAVRPFPKAAPPPQPQALQPLWQKVASFQVTKGMDVNEVLKALGPPDSLVFTGGREEPHYWQYSRFDPNAVGVFRGYRLVLVVIAGKVMLFERQAAPGDPPLKK
jgi:hypothetical protein